MTTVLALFGLVLAMVAGYVYLFGIPPGLKRELEEKAFENMGENQAAQFAKVAIGGMPTSDQNEIKDVQQGLGDLGLKNPLR